MLDTVTCMLHKKIPCFWLEGWAMGMLGMFTSLYSDGLRRVQSARTREAFSTTILWV
jgi:hypothetical protein